MITAMSLTNGTITVIIDNGKEILTARKDHAKWNEIMDAFKTRNNEKLVNLISMKAVIEHYSTGDITVNGIGVYYKNKPMHNVDVDRIMSFLNEGLPYEPIANYIAKKMKNPSSRAINELYSFLEHKNMALTPNGNFIAYKGVQINNYSIQGNVNTVVLQGKVNEEGQILNEIGATIEVERNSVCDDYKSHCAPGLHAGSLDYAIGWGYKVILVEIDPADVVCVPDDCNCKKLRCCKYKVIGDYTGPLPNSYTKEFEKEIVDKSENSDVCDSCGELNDNCECDIGPSCSEFNCACNIEDKQDNKDDEELDELFDDIVNETHSTHIVSDKPELPSTDEILDEFVNGDSQESNTYFKDYIEGYKAALADKSNKYKKYPEYMAGDEIDADSERHRQYILGYINEYSV